LAALLDAVSPDEQPGVWRRIGDGALFLAGVFPEYAQRSLGLVEIARLQRATGLRLAAVGSDVGLLLEELAAGAYDRAGADVPWAVVETPRLARRVLTLVAQRYLFPMAADWLPAAAPSAGLRLPALPDRSAAPQEGLPDTGHSPPETCLVHVAVRLTGRRSVQLLRQGLSAHPPEHERGVP
jgi:hypothetical protein